MHKTLKLNHVAPLEPPGVSYAEQALLESEERYRQIVQGLPVAVYTCDARGYIMLYNQAAAALWGREPEIGRDLWCGSWRIYRTDGAPLPLDECPMAIALKEGRIVNQEILIERPDGTRRYVMPHPQPIFTASGKIIGAVNMLSDITDKKTSEEYSATLAAIVQNSDDAIVSKSLDGIVTSWNPAAQRLFGYTAQEMVGQHITKLIPRDRLGEEAEILGRIRKGQRIDHFETKRVAKDGTLLDISLTTSPVRDVNGKITGASKIARDITAQKRLHEALRESEERFKAIANAAPVMLWLSGTDKLCNFFNKRWLDFTGGTMEKEWGNGWLDAMHLDDLPRYLDMYESSFEARKEFYIEYRLRRYDGKYRWITNNGVPRFTPEGEFEGYAGACMDITEIREHEQRKDDFIKMASHELKTPVTSIKGYIQLLLKTSIPADNPLLTNSLSIIDKQVSKLTKLITDLLDLTKIESGNLYLNKEAFNIADLTKEIAEEIQTTFLTHTIIVNIKSDAIVYADKDRISQVLINFLTNAIKYSPDADKVIIEINTSDTDVVVSVQDFGIGITKKDQCKIFERFYRVQGKNEQTFPGFGIGLFIVHEIIKNHDGNTWVESEKQKGSVFYFSLPIHFQK